MRFSYTRALDTLIEWACKEGFEDVTFNHPSNSFIDWGKSLNTPKNIEIEGKHPVEIKVYLLLHELGHHQLRKDWDKFKISLPVLAHADHIHFSRNVGKYKRRITYSVSSMEEEFKAWDEGYKLAQKLGIKINMEKWGKLKANCLLTYIRYYGTKK